MCIVIVAVIVAVFAAVVVVVVDIAVVDLSLTLVWLPSTKSLASDAPAPCVTGGAAKLSKKSLAEVALPMESTASVPAVSANSFTAALAGLPTSNRRNEGECVKPGTTRCSDKYVCTTGERALTRILSTTTLITATYSSNSDNNSKKNKNKHGTIIAVTRADNDSP